MNVSGGDEGEREEVRTRLGSPRINHGLDLISEIWDGNSAIKMSEGNFDDISTKLFPPCTLNMKYELIRC